MTATSSIVQNSFSTGADWLGRSATISGVSALAIARLHDLNALSDCLHPDCRRCRQNAIPSDGAIRVPGAAGMHVLLMPGGISERAEACQHRGYAVCGFTHRAPPSP